MKIEFESLQLFLGLVTYKVTPIDYTLLSFVLFLKMCYFNGKMPLQLEWTCQWIKLR